MLVVRDTQLEVFRDRRRQLFEDAAVASLSARSGDSPDLVRENVRNGIRQALELGLRKEAEILRWLRVMALLEAQPNRSEPAREILADSDLTPSLKLTLLETSLLP